ncbi:MAG: DUF1398 domain-containing protein [Chitinophagaceae bacterium]|jgi:uncharacterized protein YbcV (DUF1398 family)|nr:DUF1398 domain-containing protein [Chitinophagaceae bacterium]HRG81428.1 DUF1398 family protein [Chitinophagaceae bacterium]HRG91720.1 DUF1398 family protein [Chitinophagaceae bacterium]
MFQLTDIKAAHSKVKSGADFPAYIRDLIKLGVTRYDSFVNDGHVEYFGENNFQITAEAKYPELAVADTSNEESFNRQLKLHQQGQTDYPAFCRDAAEAGVEKWRVDMQQMTCTYFDKANNVMLEEKIPAL